MESCNLFMFIFIILWNCFYMRKVFFQRYGGRDVRYKQELGQLLFYLIIRLNNVLYIVPEKKIHTHPMEGHWKFLGGGES